MHRDSLDDTCVINENVDCSNFLLNSCNKCLNLIFLGYITNLTESLDASLLILSKSLVNKFLVDIVEDDLSSALCISYCICKAGAV